MSRPLRRDILYDGCLAHVRIRFNNAAFRFIRKVHFALWVTIMQLYQKRYISIKVRDYKWMSTHAHFIIKVGNVEDLSNFMRDVCGKFACKYNKIEGRKGHLFHERFKATLIDSNEYHHACQRYIYRNQLRAGMVPHVEDSYWTSYHYYAWGEPNKLISPARQPFDDLYYNGTLEEKRRQFRDYVCQMTPEEEEDVKMRLRYRQMSGDQRTK